MSLEHNALDHMPNQRRKDSRPLKTFSILSLPWIENRIIKGIFLSETIPVRHMVCKDEHVSGLPQA